MSATLTTERERVTTLPLTIPAPDASDDEVRRHFMDVGLVFASYPHDTTTIMCYTCCAIGENTLGRSSRSGRTRFDTEACAALFERRYGATAPVQQDAEGVEEGEDMATKKAAKKKGARVVKKAPSRVQAAPKAKAPAPEVAKAIRATEAIDPADLRVGTKLLATYKGDTYRAEVVPNGDKVGIKLGGETFKSLSAAGSKVTGGAVNGRKFWSIAS